MRFGRRLGGASARAAARAALFLAALLLAAALPVGCEPPVVQVVPVEAGSVESTATSIEAGVVKARHDSTLQAPVSGRIVEIFHQEGDRVKPKEALIRLENDLERVALEEARVDLKRLQELLPVAAAAADTVDRARFALERAEIAYERTFIRTPFAGVLVELNANLGEMTYGTMPLNLVVGGSTEKAMARVIDDSQLYIEAHIDEADVGRLRPSLTARVTVDGLGGKVLPGRLVKVGQTISTAEGRSRTVYVEIEIEGQPPAADGDSGSAVPGLMVGMSADVEVIFERVTNVPRVPTLVILEGESGKTVYVVQQGKLDSRPIKVGATNWEWSEIREGLRLGDQVVIPTDRRELIVGREVKAELQPAAGKK